MPPVVPVALKGSPTGRATTPRVTITTAIDPATRDRLARIAVTQERSFSSLVREALERLVADYQRREARR